MAYTNPWSNTIPPGSQAANTIDDELRRLRLDIFERMNTIVPDWTADPITLTPGAGSLVGRDYSYNANGAEPKAGGANDIKSMLNLDFSGTTNVGGDITVNLNDPGFSEAWAAANIVGFQATGTIVTGDDPVRITMPFINPTPNTFVLHFKKNDGAPVPSSLVQATVQVYFNALPA